MRLKNTLEYLVIWEQLNNPSFKGVDFDPLLKDAGSNAFTMSPSRWAELTPIQTSIVYANEADVLNVAMFGVTETEPNGHSANEGITRSGKQKTIKVKEQSYK